MTGASERASHVRLGDTGGTGTGRAAVLYVVASEAPPASRRASRSCPGDRRLYVHCLSGSRAAIASSRLDASGFDVVLVADGLATRAQLRQPVDWGGQAAEPAAGGPR